MPELVVVAKENLEGKHWETPQNFSFAARDALCPLVLFETNKAAIHLPIAFSKHNDGFLLVAVQGLELGTNFLVDNAGKWIGPYIPAPYRAYPFSFATANDDSEVLCVDLASGLISEGDEEGIAFFESNGEPNEKVKGVFQFLSHIAQNRKPTQNLCDLLQSLDLFEPWPIDVNKDGVETKVEGLFRINEIKFNELKADDLIKLRDAGGIPLVYCQLLSMQNLPRIAQQAAPQRDTKSIPQELNFDLAKDDGNISFDGL